MMLSSKVPIVGLGSWRCWCLSASVPTIRDLLSSLQKCLIDIDEELEL